jgi:glycogen(starch) synthase
VCYFGRLEERKGVAVLAHALPALFDRYPRVSMVFVGEDLGYRGVAVKEYIRRRVGERFDRCVFFDNLPQEALFPVVKAARLVVLPSLWEAFGFVCVEAMALGKPVIATSGSGFDEIIQDGVSGYLVEPGNSEALLDRMIACLADEEALAEVANAAQKRARDFETATIAQRVAAYFERVAADARPTLTAAH